MNPGLYLLVEQGYYDLATPTHAPKYNLNQSRLTPETRGRIRVNYHGAGHMMYLHEDSARRFRENRRFYSGYGSVVIIQANQILILRRSQFVTA